ncbi:class I SAM-dependent methyltransferase [Aquiflexum sp.]|uniref:class I SAM-dependent methyltransferase n=1 Tax=Aquiflexum sp. TaxID=1872584 RepID=UPI00359471A2
MKDLFSNHSEEYAQFRPSYPKVLFDFVVSHCKGKESAWDCATGNGQVAGHLSNYFKKVEATDISEKQLENAITRPNVYYSKQSAENTIFPDQHFDLITVGQAIHWFDFKGFYKEVNRTGKKDSLLLVLGYGKLSAAPELDGVIDELYRDILEPYWEPERKYIDEKYLTIPFPFKEIKTPEFKNSINWKIDQLIGYLNTWSAVKKYIQLNVQNPVNLVSEKLKVCWGSEVERKIEFPLLVRLGKIH